MIFIVSSIPNQTRKRGTRAEMGRNRSGSTRGDRKCFTGGNVPMRRPRGMATTAESRKPMPTR
jgi:hypothetical protein